MASPISRRARSPSALSSAIVGMRLPLAIAHEIAGRLLHDPFGHRPALGLVGREQAAAAPSLDHRGELPAEIGGIAHAGVETEAAGRRVLMRRVAGEEDPPAPYLSATRSRATHAQHETSSCGTGLPTTPVIRADASTLSALSK